MRPLRVKPGRDQEFLDAHKKVQADWPGLKRVNMIKTGERSYCIIAEWTTLRRSERAPAHDRDAQFVPRHAGGSGRRTRRHRSGVRPGVLELK